MLKPSPVFDAIYVKDNSIESLSELNNWLLEREHMLDIQLNNNYGVIRPRAYFQTDFYDSRFRLPCYFIQREQSWVTPVSVKDFERFYVVA